MSSSNRIVFDLVASKQAEEKTSTDTAPKASALELELQQEERDRLNAIDILKNRSRVYSTEDECQKAVEKVARKIINKFPVPKNLVLVPILEGAAMFAADIQRQLFKLDPYYAHRVQSMKIKSYGKSEKAKEPIVTLMPDNIEGRTILLIDDLIDRGPTLEFARKRLLEAGAKEVFFITFMNKVAINVDYKKNNNLNPLINGINADNEWFIGYGMDNEEHLRNLPYVIAKNIEKSEDHDNGQSKPNLSLVSSKM